MIGLPTFSLRTLAMLPIMAFAAAPSWPTVEAAGEMSSVGIAREMQSALSGMSTGDAQELLVAGTDAQSRNKLIPVVGGNFAYLSAYSPMGQQSTQYGMALRCLTQAIYYEAANEPEDGKKAVAQVVMNRMRHPAYPDSVCGVVYQGANARVCQFSFTCDGALLRRPMQRQWDESARIARLALAGEQFTPVGTATHYHADYVLPKWAFTLEKLKVIGAHIFYRFPGRGGSTAAFTDLWSRSEAIPQLDWERLARAQELDAVPEMVEPVETFVPGLTVTAHPSDRHASADVGGRLDTTKQWRLSIPDPVATKSRYDAAVAEQAGSMTADMVADTEAREPTE
ncbi:cell wall hydrolase [Parerythrobacter aurantius]|uniref:cell wall hydrolase n=1 Tax=Parerythrobacter aurantius TaxID=3127706 RepID=UPI00324DA2EB